MYFLSNESISSLRKYFLQEEIMYFTIHRGKFTSSLSYEKKEKNKIWQDKIEIIVSIKTQIAELFWCNCKYANCIAHNTESFEEISNFLETRTLENYITTTDG